MSQEERRQIKEALADAKNNLMDALRLAESANAPKAIRLALGSLCGKTEALQARF